MGSVMGPSQAAALVEARLGRPAQDALEAAVVLEAWGGLRPPVALRLGEAIKSAEIDVRVERRPEEASRRSRWRLSEHIALIVALIALLAWSGPLISAYGARAFELSWMIAVPLTLGTQHAMRRRYLAGPDGLGRLRTDGKALLLVAFVVPPVLAAGFGVGGALAGLMVILWVTASIVGRRGWGLWHGLLLSSAAAALWEGFPSLSVLALAGVGALGLAVAAVRTSQPTKRRPGAWRPVLLSTATGCGLGVMLILDGGVHWDTSGPLPALVLLPSVLAGLWAGAHLDRLWDVLAIALRETTLRQPAQQRARRSATRVVVAAILRLVVLAGVLSIAVWLSPWAQTAPDRLVGGLLGGFALIALASLTVTLTESFGRPNWALGSVVVGIGCEIALRLAVSDPVPGAGLAVGGAAAVLVTLPSVAALLRQPARTLATVVNVQ